VAFGWAVMLLSAIIFGSVASVVGGWVFMCDAMPDVGRPRMAYCNWPSLLVVLCGLTAIVLFFCIKWYWGLLAIPGLIMAVNSFAGVWNTIYRVFKL